MAGPPWPWVWPRFTAHGHGHIRGREQLFWGDQLPIPTRYKISVLGNQSPILNFWPGGTSPPTPTCGHGRVAMGMSLATFYRTWPWPYVGVSYFFGGTSCLYVHAMRYRSAEGPVPPPNVTFLAWGRFTALRHGHGHVLPRPVICLVLSPSPLNYFLMN